MVVPERKGIAVQRKVLIHSVSLRKVPMYSVSYKEGVD
jgi:hypothetical protein